MKELYIGLMSGTSADGIDAVLVDFGQTFPSVIATHYTPYSSDLKKKILGLCEKGENEIHRLGELDIELGKAFSEAAKIILEKNFIPAESIKAIGSHGQTIRHSPLQFTIQIADPNTIAAETGITTVADFRRKDMAYGGQGAPLVPAFHQHVLSTQEHNRAVVNIGGIANVTILSKNSPLPVIGFDTGPGNVLMDNWIRLHHQKNHDENGNWAAEGKIHQELLNRFLDDPYFKLSSPKSTGREYFDLSWLNYYLKDLTVSITDMQTTLTELTARTVINAIQQHIPSGEILICGGGVHNDFLISRLRTLSHPQFTIDSTKKYGIDPDWMEAMAFAWLARQTLNQLTGNLPSVTGAKRAAILGGIYYA